MSPNGNGTKQPHVGERGMMSPNDNEFSHLFCLECQLGCRHVSNK